jgi:hypothetical protein
MGGKEQLPSEHELAPLVQTLGQQFVQRWDMYPKQLKDGTYVTIHELLNDSLLQRHLQGRVTLGTYLLDQNSRGRFLLFDADSPQAWQQLQQTSRLLAQEGLTSYLEKSRRGGHLWLFLSQYEPGELVRRFGLGVRQFFGIEGVELYPRQEHLLTGPGSLIRLPFGVHRVSGRRYGFYYHDGSPLAPTVTEQIYALRTPQPVPERLFQRFLEYGLRPNTKPNFEASKRADRSASSEIMGVAVSDRIRASISVREFVSHYMPLSSRGKGLCPFHDDQKPSFSVNDEANYWYCFACGTGGSIIDFWMQWRHCDFQTAIRELADMLL